MNKVKIKHLRQFKIILDHLNLELSEMLSRLTFKRLAIVSG